MPGTAATGGMRKEPQPVLINGASFEATGRALGRWSLSVAPLDLLDIGRSSGARARSPLSLPPSPTFLKYCRAPPRPSPRFRSLGRPRSGRDIEISPNSDVELKEFSIEPPLPTPDRDSVL